MSGGSSAVLGAAGAGDGTEDKKCTAEYLAYSTGEANGLHPAVSGTALEVRLLESDQSPPPRKGYNTWTIALRNAATGEPASDATISWACSYMEVHGHGTNPKMVEPLGDGKFRLVKQNFAMVGQWLVKLWIDPTGAQPLYAPSTLSTIANGQACNPTSGLQGSANAVFKICVPERF